MPFHLHPKPDFRLKEGNPKVDVTPDTTYILHFPFEELGINFCLFGFYVFIGLQAPLELDGRYEKSTMNQGISRHHALAFHANQQYLNQGSLSLTHSIESENSTFVCKNTTKTFYGFVDASTVTIQGSQASQSHKKLELYYCYYPAGLPGGKNKNKGRSSVQTHSLFMRCPTACVLPDNFHAQKNPFLCQLGWNSLFSFTFHYYSLGMNKSLSFSAMR